MKNLGITDGVKIGNDYWCVSAYYNGLWRMALDDGMAYMETDLPVHIEECGGETCRAVMRYGDNNVVLVTVKLTIIIYNIIQKQLTEIRLEDIEGYMGDIRVVGGAGMSENKITIYPSFVSGNRAFAYVVDIHKMCMERVELSHRCCSDKRVTYELGHFVSGHNIYISLSNESCLVKLDMENLEMETYQYQLLGIVASNVCVDGNVAYLFPDTEAPVAYINLKNREVGTLNYCAEGFKRKSCKSFSNIVLYNGIVYPFMGYGNMELVIKNGKIFIEKKLTELMESIINTDMSDTISPVIFSRAEMYEGIMYIISPKANMLYEYDVAREDIKEYKGYVSDDTVLAWTSFEIESKIYKLEYWIKYLKDL